ncbi:MAG: hypothetical protein ACT4PM_04130 [Gemmatimonadales bacterium]
MLRKIGLAVFVVVAAVLGAGVAFRLQGAAFPGLPRPTLPETLRQLSAPTDSVAAARIAMNRCRLLWKTSQRQCYEEFLLDLVERGRVRLAMGTLSLIAKQDPYVQRFGHDFAHVIGINAWEPGEDIGAVYSQCNEQFQSGCYHGVVQAFFAKQGTDSASLAGLCNNPGINRNTWLRFQCVHGIGHGLVQNYTMNLPRALAGCDLLASAWDAESCYGGAFMEFIVGGRGQSHHPAAQGEPGEAAHHGGHGTRADSFPPFKVRDPKDPLYPCSALGHRYQRSCYMMQAGLIAEYTGLDFEKIARHCDRAPEQWRRWCYQGIGTYVSGVVVRDPVRGTEECLLGHPRYRPFCFVGLVKNFVDVTANIDDGLNYCRPLSAEDIATACYVAVGEEAAVLFPAMERRAEACGRAVPAHVEACRWGAGLSANRPAAYPNTDS